MSPKTISRAKDKTPKTPRGTARKVAPTPEERAEALTWLKRYGAIFNKGETRIIGVRPM